MKKINFQYHPEIDMLEIEGLYYSGEFFRNMSEIRGGKTFSAIRRDGSLLYSQSRPAQRVVDVYHRVLAWARGAGRRR